MKRKLDTEVATESGHEKKAKTEPESSTKGGHSGRRRIQLVTVNITSGAGECGPKHKTCKNIAVWKNVAGHVYCGRKVGMWGKVITEGSPFANPNHVKPTARTNKEDEKKERERVIGLFIRDEIETNKLHIRLRDELVRIARANPNLTSFRLGCWCKPKACHVDALIEHVLRLRDDKDDIEFTATATA